MAAKRPSEEYSQLRSRVHLGIGAPVMLIVKNLWDSRTVHLGLMNGARGHVVAIVAKEVGPALPQCVVIKLPQMQGRALLGRPSDVGACGTGATAVEEITEASPCAIAVEARMGVDCPQGAGVDVP